MDVALRTAIIEDARHVAELVLSSRRAFLPYARSPHTDAECHEWVREALIPSGGVTVACVGPSIVGVLATAREAATSWINQLYVSPGHVGQGIGARLLGHALRTLPLPVRLYTFQANLRARSFYEHHGFKAIAFTDGSANEERCPDVLYELASPSHVEAQALLRAAIERLASPTAPCRPCRTPSANPPTSSKPACS